MNFSGAFIAVFEQVTTESEGLMRLTFQGLKVF